MDYKKLILQKLLNKYESSIAFSTGATSKRIAVQLSKEKELYQRMEDPDEKRSFLYSLEELHRAEILEYSWVKYEKGNLIDRFWLNYQDQENLENAYRIAGMVPMRQRLDTCRSEISAYAKNISKQWIKMFLEDSLNYIDQKRKLPRIFQEGQWRDLLKALEYLDTADSEILERVFSSHVYGDSKWFEKNVKAKLLSVIRQTHNDMGEFQTDEELLQMAGISKYPEVMEFSGRISAVLNNGKRVDYSNEIYGAYINSYLVREVAEIDLAGISKIIFIENKANYIWYLLNQKEEHELVVYHGGFYSPAKGKLFEKIYQASAGQNICFYHWGDLDLGGILIFCRLRDQIIPELQPYKMDAGSFGMYKQKGIAITNKAYRSKLENMLKENRYEVFWDLITAILESDLVIEQEMMII